MEIRVITLPEDQRKPKFTDESQLGFGKMFTDRMFIVEWKVASLGRCQNDSYAPFSLDPACLVLHYAREILRG